MRLASVGFGWLLLASAGFADVRLPAIFGDRMVLQQGIPAPVWGWAAAGERVTVSVADQSKTATAGADGRWRVALDPLKPGDPVEMIVAGKNTITLKDVLVGEVWIGSGQSNMFFPLEKAANGPREVADAAFPAIRLFSVKMTIADEPKDDTEGSWSPCTPETAKSFSAVAYFFGRELHRTLNVPVGLIHCSWGGSPAEAWTSRETLEGDADFRPILERWREAVEDAAGCKATHERRLKEWKAAVEKAKAEKSQLPTEPALLGPKGPFPHHQPVGLWNGMIRPVAPFAIRGAIWYQGETNGARGRGYQYRKLFPAMIGDWRRLWGEGDFPFLFVQLANFHDPDPGPVDSLWAELREAQLLTLKASPNTGMAVIIDIGDAQDIHPVNKQDVGKRLALSALTGTYGKSVVGSGPIYESMAAEGGGIRLKFKHIGGGLEAKGGPLKGFAVAGDDRKFVWAVAAIDGGTVVVSSPNVPKPAAVRYAWADNPAGCNLYNQEGLPASPFRTDDWPGLSDKNR